MLDRLLDELHGLSASDKGRAFERLCVWYLKNAPEYRTEIRHVWLWSEWPGRWGSDAGIDLVAETVDGAIWTIQAKAYSPQYAVKKADVDSFLSESSRPGVAYRLLIATTDRLGANADRTLRQQEKAVGLKLLSQLRSEAIRWPGSLRDLRAVRPRPKTPRAHQREAIRDVVNGLRKEDRGQLLMACGTGKTLTSLWIDESLRSERTLVLVPSLSLLGQTLRAWASNTRTPFAYLAVCSDATVAGDDAFTEHPADLGFPVTTDPERVAQFLQSESGRRVVFATYQSSPVIARAHCERHAPAFDVVFADEAHRCAGPTASDFATVLDGDRIVARKRVFMTATPRYLTSRLRKSGSERDRELVSMDDDVSFGPELHRLSFGEAIHRELLAEYQVVVVGVDQPSYARLAERGELVTRDGKTGTDARTLARQIGVAQAMRRFDLRKVITFHSRVAAARRFADELPDVIAWMPKDARPQGALWSAHVAGTMNAGRRDALLDRFRQLDKGERGVLANARCLAEGVDVPAVDGVAFVDPRRSIVDIIQAVGRVIRRAPGKSVGTVVIPVFIEPGMSDESVLEGSGFNIVWEVVRGLRAHDDVLADQLDGARRRTGREGSASSVGVRIILDLPHGIGEDFAEAFDARLIEETTATWQHWYGVLESFVATHGHARVPMRHAHAGVWLGKWVTHQRDRRASLSADRSRALERLPGWTWDAREGDSAGLPAALGSYVAREGHARVPAGHIESGFSLGRWVSAQRRMRNSMGTERVARLESLPGWTWDPGADRWQEGLDALIAFAEREGHVRVPPKHQESGFSLGPWVKRQHSEWRRHSLSVERTERLEQIEGWAWKSEPDRALEAQSGSPDIVGRGEVAAILGVRGVNLARLKNLPDPVDRVKATTLWRRSEIEAFAARRANGMSTAALSPRTEAFEVGAYVGRTEAAEILGVEGSNLGKLGGMPDPAVRLEATTLWRRDEIERLARKRAQR